MSLLVFSSFRLLVENTIHISWKNIKFYLILANDPGLFSGAAFITKDVNIIAKSSLELTGSKVVLQCLKFKSSLGFSVFKDANLYPIPTNEALLELFRNFKWLPSAAKSEWMADEIHCHPHHDNNEFNISPLFKLRIHRLLEAMEQAIFSSFNLVFHASDMKVEENDPETLAKLHVGSCFYLVDIF